jgi:hypothetical protein
MEVVGQEVGMSITVSGGIQQGAGGGAKSGSNGDSGGNGGNGGNGGDDGGTTAAASGRAEDIEVDAGIAVSGEIQ